MLIFVMFPGSAPDGTVTERRYARSGAVLGAALVQLGLLWPGSLGVLSLPLNFPEGLSRIGEGEAFRSDPRTTGKLTFLFAAGGSWRWNQPRVKPSCGRAVPWKSTASLAIGCVEVKVPLGGRQPERVV